MNEVRFREAEQRLWRSVGAAPTERRLHLARTGVTVRVQETGEGPPALLVHGASNAGTSWAQLVARLPHYRCILLDRPGCGLSDPVPTRFDDVGRLEAFADALIVDVLDALALDTAHVLATSFGAYFALRTAAAHPERVERTAVYGWPVGAPMAGVPFAMRVVNVRVLGRIVASIPPNERVVRMILRQAGLARALENGNFSPESIAWYLALLRDTDTMRNELDAGPRLVTPVRGINTDLLLPPALLATVNAPTLLLWGDEDPMSTIAIAHEFAARFPHAALEIVPRAGHAVWIDDPDHIAERTHAFLDGEACA
jgi:2-hydroxy-6-oxonona-2,4-dienedioate hydrolase